MPPDLAAAPAEFRNHVTHTATRDRGQLTVYLRELGVPILSIYGPSVDENPFA